MPEEWHNIGTIPDKSHKPFKFTCTVRVSDKTCWDVTTLTFLPEFTKVKSCKVEPEVWEGGGSYKIHKGTSVICE